jgi:hypothetical protein
MLAVFVLHVYGSVNSGKEERRSRLKTILKVCVILVFAKSHFQTFHPQVLPRMWQVLRFTHQGIKRVFRPHVNTVYLRNRLISLQNG